MAGGSIVEQLDATIAQFFASWNIYTTALLLVLLTAVLYPLLTGKEPDIHPFLLARQAQAAPVRQPQESAVLRAVEIPHGYPLRAGLGVRDPSAPKWSPGRNGDLRDIWRQAERGPLKDDGSPSGSKSKILTVLGREKVIEHSFQDLTRDINIIGKYVQDRGVKSVAVCLANSTELLCSIFAAAFYDFSLVLLPYGLTGNELTQMIAQTKAELLIGEAGTIEIDTVQSSTSSIRNFLWVMKGANKHMDWSQGSDGGVSMGTWNEVIDSAKSSTSNTPLVFEKDSTPQPLSTFVSIGDGDFELVQFTSANLISGTSALNNTFSRGQKITSSDIFQPTTPLTDSYTLCITLAALFSGATVALNSVAGDKVDLAAATAGVAPTIITAAPDTVLSFHSQLTKTAPGLPTKINQYFQGQTLQKGSMPAKRPSVAIGTLRKLRALLVAQPASLNYGIPSSTLSSLRLLLGTRITYALTTPKVAGAICQTNLLDYRDKGGVVCVGPPVSSVEVHVTGQEKDLTKGNPKGKLAVKGPAVSGGKIVLNTTCRFDDDYTIILT